MIWIYVCAGALALSFITFFLGILVGLVFWEEIADGLISIMHFVGLGE